MDFIVLIVNLLDGPPFRLLNLLGALLLLLDIGIVFLQDEVLFFDNHPISGDWLTVTSLAAVSVRIAINQPLFRELV